MSKLILFTFLISNLANAEYFEVTNTVGSPEYSKCARVDSGTVRDAIQKIKSSFHSCKDQETLVMDTFSVLCKDPRNNPPSQIFFYSKNEKSCMALIEFQKTKKVPVGFRKKNG